MGKLTFKRNQMEWALWRAFTIGRRHGDAPPQIFKTRIKRLLDVDRDFDPLGEAVGDVGDYAFAPAVEEGRGVDAAYSSIDIFCLAVGLDLLDIGFKQSEIVFVLRHIRPSLEARYPALVKLPSLTDRQTKLARSHPGLPKFVPPKKTEAQADARVFMVLGRIELTEVMPTGSVSRGQAVFPAPLFCDGVENLAATLYDQMPNRRRSVIVVELTALAQAVAEFLAKAPVVRRGRPTLKT